MLLSLVLAEDFILGIPTMTTGPDGMPVSGVRPVCPSAKLSNPTVSTFMPGIDVVTTIDLLADSAGNEVGRCRLPPGADASADPGDDVAATSWTSDLTATALLLSTRVFSAAETVLGASRLSLRRKRTAAIFDKASALAALPTATPVDEELTVAVLPTVLPPTVDGPQ